MNISTFNCSLKQTLVTLKKYGLLKQNLTKRNLFLLEQFDEYSKINNYIEAYRFGVEKLFYHILLFDESFIQFKFSEKNIRYSYYECPFKYLSYEEYLKSCGFDYEEVGESFRNEYDQFILETDMKNYILPIRYEYSEIEYTPGLHPSSHVHFGVDTDVRIPVSTKITPLVFTLFVLKHCYYKEWKRIYTDIYFNKILSKSKKQCTSIENDYFKAVDQLELILR